MRVGTCGPSQKRFARMQQAELYLDYAAECLKLVARISEPGHRLRLIELAPDWCELAELQLTGIRQHQRRHCHIGQEQPYSSRFGSAMSVLRH
jgi:hypothetical protein